MANNKLNFSKILLPKSAGARGLDYMDMTMAEAVGKPHGYEKEYMAIEKCYNDETSPREVVSATDYALACGVMQGKGQLTFDGKIGACHWLNNADGEIAYVNGAGELENTKPTKQGVGVRPTIYVDVKALNEELNKNNCRAKINRAYDENTEKAHYTIELGEYPNSVVEYSESLALNEAYKAGKMTKTGKTYTGSIVSTRALRDGSLIDCVQKAKVDKNEEFEFGGEKYVRANTKSYLKEGDLRYNPAEEDQIGQTLESTVRKYANGETISGVDAEWFKVEPITWEITNWDEMPKFINPEGLNFSNVMQLKAKEVVTPDMCYAVNDDAEIDWKESLVSAYLNGETIENADFNNHGFLNEAFDVTKEMLKHNTINNDRVR